MEKRELTITVAENGFVLTGEKWTRVIEGDPDGSSEEYDRLTKGLGIVFCSMLNEFMYPEVTHSFNLKLVITKEEE